MRPFLSPLLLFVVFAVVVVVRPLHNARDAAARERKLRFELWRCLCLCLRLCFCCCCGLALLLATLTRRQQLCINCAYSLLSPFPLLPTREREQPETAWEWEWERERERALTSNIRADKQRRLSQFNFALVSRCRYSKGVRLCVCVRVIALIAPIALRALFLLLCCTGICFCNDF